MQFVRVRVSSSNGPPITFVQNTDTGVVKALFRSLCQVRLRLLQASLNMLTQAALRAHACAVAMESLVCLFNNKPSMPATNSDIPCAGTSRLSFLRILSPRAGTSPRWFLKLAYVDYVSGLLWWEMPTSLRLAMDAYTSPTYNMAQGVCLGLPCRDLADFTQLESWELRLNS